MSETRGGWGMRWAGAGAALATLPRAALAAGAAAWLATLLAGCAHHPPRGPSRALAAPAVDSVTTALWRFDETGGTAAADSAAGRLDGIAGPDVTIDLGRFGRARTFANSVNSFVVVPSNPRLDLVPPFTLETWVRPSGFSAFTFGTLLAHMADAGTRRSYIFAVTGFDQPRPGRPPHPLFGNDPALKGAGPGRLWFAFVPSGAWSGLYSFLSVATLDAGTWSHVAVTYDGATVRFYIDGQLDSQHAATGIPARVDMPLVIGNYLDTDALSDFSGFLQVNPGLNSGDSYPFEGQMDEVRISHVARERFLPAR